MNVTGELRRFVAERAGRRCEYCLFQEDDSYSTHHIDHIISRKHGGLITPDNLAYACLRRNTWKGSDVGSFDSATERLVALFNPRHQEWAEHFRLQGFLIEPLTAAGRVTAKLLRLNIDKRVVERRALIQVGRYPR